MLFRPDLVKRISKWVMGLSEFYITFELLKFLKV